MGNENQTTSVTEAQSQALHAVVRQLMGTKGVHHALVAMESRDRRFRWTGAEGIARPDGTPMKATTPFWIASITKLYIAAAILKLHESQQLAIDDRVATYLSGELLNGVHVVDGVDYGQTVTIRHLLRHASGIPDYLELKLRGEKPLFEQVLEGDDTAWTLADILEIVRGSKAPLFAPQPLNAKSYRVRYSDTNFQLLIGIIEKVTDQPIAEAFRTILFEPLHLRQTSHPGTEPLNPVGPVAAVWAEDKPFVNKPQAMQSFGDLNSTASDLIEFMRALIDGRVFSKPTTLELMRDHWNTFGFALSPIAPGWPIQYGLGMMRFQMPRLFTPFRALPEVIGHTGAVGSWLFYCPPLDMIVTGTVSQVTAGAVPFKVVPKLLRILEKNSG